MSKTKCLQCVQFLLEAGKSEQIQLMTKRNHIISTTIRANYISHCIEQIMKKDILPLVFKPKNREIMLIKL